MTSAVKTAASDTKSACLVVFLFGGNPRIKTPLCGLNFLVRVGGLCIMSHDFNRRHFLDTNNILAPLHMRAIIDMIDRLIVQTAVGAAGLILER